MFKPLIFASQKFNTRDAYVICMYEENETLITYIHHDYTLHPAHWYDLVGKVDFPFSHCFS
jgi:hypothetical protein